MSKLPSVTGNQAIKAFEKEGFSVVRVTGSHHIMKKEGHTYNLSVPLHAGTPLKKGTLRQLIRDAGLTQDDFIALLD